MEIVQSVLTNSGLVLAVLLGVSESLALIPQVKSNSIFQLVSNVLKTLTGKQN